MTDRQGREAIPAIARLLNSIDTCMFISRGDDGELHARPMSNNGDVEWDGASWFFAPADGRLVSELRRDPATVTAYRAEGRFSWVSLAGQAAFVDDADAKRQRWQKDFERWFPNGPDDPNVALIRIDATSAEWWTEGGDGSADLG